MDFNKYDDIFEVCKYEGFIDRDGYYYKVTPRVGKSIKDTHNEWAEAFMKQKLNIKDFKFNPTASALITLATLGGPANILVNCFGYVYYSHDPYLYKPIIEIPNPKIANYKVTEEQLDTLYNLMLFNNENTDISIFNSDNEDFDYSGMEDDSFTLRKKKD